jgi:hypothetical protein
LIPDFGYKFCGKFNYLFIERRRICNMIRTKVFEGRLIELRYFRTTMIGRRAIYSTEVRLSSSDKDRIIIDGTTPWMLENKLRQILPALIHSRSLGE